LHSEPAGFLARQPCCGFYRAAREYRAGFRAMDKLDAFMFGCENDMMVTSNAAAA
jgi:hypothetical protein